MKKKTNLKQYKKRKINMDAQEKKNEEMNMVSEEAAEQLKEQPAEAEGNAEQETEQVDTELTPEETLQAEIDKLTKEQEELKDKYLRSVAEFDIQRVDGVKDRTDT